MGTVIEGPWERCLDVDEDDRPALRLVVTQSCEGCVFATFGQGGIYCTQFSEWILDEEAAGADCPVFEVAQ